MRRMCAGHKLIRHAKHRDEHAYYSTAWAALIWCIPSDKMGSSPSSPPPAPPSFNLLQTNHVVSSSQTKREREREGVGERDRGWAREKESEREDWSWFRGGVITSAAAGGPQWGRENHFCRLDLPVFFLPILHHRAITKPTQYHPPPPQRSTEALEQLHSTAGATEVQGSNLFSWIYDTCRKLICVHTLKYRCSR